MIMRSFDGNTNIFGAMILCNEILVDKNIYLSNSQEEIAIADYMRQHDIIIKQRNQHGVVISVKEIDSYFKILATISFDPIRKCMSIILKHIQGPKIFDFIDDNDVFVLTKGADDVMRRISHTGFDEMENIE